MSSYLPFMFVKTTKKQNGSTSVRIVENFRDGNKVTQKTVRTMGQYKDSAEIEIAIQFAEKIILELNNAAQPALPGLEEVNSLKRRKKQFKEENENTLNINNVEELQRLNNGVEVVYGKLYEQLSFDGIINDSNKWKNILKSVVLQRIADPSSKRKTQINLNRYYDEDIALHNIYRMMDRLDDKRVKDAVKESTFNLFDKVDVLCFDVTTLYFESFENNDLLNPGFSKDNKFKESQVMLALITNSDGHPITYELFPGNTYEGSTLIKVIDQLSTQWKIEKVVLVADRAMFNEANLKLMEEKNIQYVVAAKLKGLNSEIKNQILSDDFAPGVVENEFIWHKEYDLKNRRLIVSYSTKRARKDSFDRTRLVERVKKNIGNSKINISDIIPNKGTKKYLKIMKVGEAVLSEDKIKADAKWDGLHGVITNVKDINPEMILKRYKNLWKIEEAFRANKHDLKMRPIFHWTSKRIKAHVSICFLAYALYYAIIKKLKDGGLNLSGDAIREELLSDQFSLIKDTSKNKIYQLYSKPTQNLKCIYKILGMNRPTGMHLFS